MWNVSFHTTSEKYSGIGPEIRPKKAQRYQIKQIKFKLFI